MVAHVRLLPPLLVLVLVLVLVLLAAGNPANAQEVELELDALRAALHPQSPAQVSARGGNELAVVDLPVHGSGETREFVLVRDEQLLAPGLAAKFPGLAAFAGVEVTPVRAEEPPIRALVTFSDAAGLHLELRSARDGVWHADPVAPTRVLFRSAQNKANSSAHDAAPACRQAASSNGRRLQEADQLPGCPDELVATLADRVCNPAANTAACAYDGGDCCSVFTKGTCPACECLDPQHNAVEHRRYRLALAATKEYVAAKGASVASALASAAALVQRLNDVLLREVGASFQIVDGSEALFDATGSIGFDNSPDGATQLPAAAAERLPGGEAAFDLGHLLGTSGDGIAGDIGVLCGPMKGVGYSGVGGGAKPPEWLLAHEVGHQLGADHTFTSCGEQRSSAKRGVEAGSGMTIMSYQGICGEENMDDRQEIGHLYFHSQSLEQIAAYLRNPLGGAACGELVPPDGSGAGRRRPEFRVDLDFDPCDGVKRACRIPKLTPFRLEGNRALQMTEDRLYTWEQVDVAESNALDANSVTAPQTPQSVLFASVPPRRNDAVRVFPRMAVVRRGMDLEDSRARLPTLARKMHFALVVRASSQGGGGGETPVASTFVGDRVTVQVVDEEPLRVAPLAPSSLVPGESFQVRWEGGARSTQEVRVLLSLDDGLTFPTVLLTRAPNTGEATVTMPAEFSCFLGRARVKVESLNDLDGCSFFAITDVAIAVDGCESLDAPPVSSWPRLRRRGRELGAREASPLPLQRPSPSSWMGARRQVEVPFGTQVVGDEPAALVWALGAEGTLLSGGDATQRVSLTFEHVYLREGALLVFDGRDSAAALLLVIAAGDDSVPRGTTSSGQHLFLRRYGAQADAFELRASVAHSMVSTEACPWQQYTGPPPPPPDTVVDGAEIEGGDNHSGVQTGVIVGIGAGAAVILVGAVAAVAIAKQRQGVVSIPPPPPPLPPPLPPSPPPPPPTTTTTTTTTTTPTTSPPTPPLAVEVRVSPQLEL